MSEMNMMNEMTKAVEDTANVIRGAGTIVVPDYEPLFTERQVKIGLAVGTGVLVTGTALYFLNKKYHWFGKKPEVVDTSKPFVPEVVQEMNKNEENKDKK